MLRVAIQRGGTSGAVAAPMADQWTASNPCCASRSTQLGDRFMSTSSFTAGSGELQLPPPATRRRTRPARCPRLQDTDNSRRISSRVRPAATRPTTVPTVTRILRIHGFPPITRGARVIRVSCGMWDDSSDDTPLSTNSPSAPTKRIRWGSRVRLAPGQTHPSAPESVAGPCCT